MLPAIIAILIVFISVDMLICADPESFVRGGPTLKSDNVFFYFFSLIDEGRDDPNTTNCWQSSARQRNVIEMTFRLRANAG